MNTYVGVEMHVAAKNYEQAHTHQLILTLNELHNAVVSGLKCSAKHSWRGVHDYFMRVREGLELEGIRLGTRNKDKELVVRLGIRLGARDKARAKGLGLGIMVTPTPLSLAPSLIPSPSPLVLSLSSSLIPSPSPSPSPGLIPSPSRRLMK